MENLSSVFDLVQILESMVQTRVLCVGDVMLDKFVYGKIDRISPEAPIPVLQFERESQMLGGAGNVLRNLTALRAQGTLLSVVGQDESAARIKELGSELKSAHLDLVADAARPTTLKTRYISGNQQMLRVDDESKSVLNDIMVEQLCQRAKNLVAKSQAVILSDYGKGTLHSKLISEIIAAAKQTHVPVLVDPKGVDYSRYRGATILCPNLKELAQGSNHPVDTEENIIAAAKLLIQQVDLQALLVTRSKDGMSLIARDGSVLHLPAQAREVFDVSGAGDTSIATLAAAIATGASLPDAAHLANTAAGIVVGKLGTAVVMPSEIDEALMAHQGRVRSKLFDLPSLLDRVKIWRHQGYKIGFTNGCFDLIHPGHVSLLRQARNSCDRLIVAMNTDNSVKRLKGPSRPVQNQDSRSTVMSSMDNVDAVILFDEDTPMNLLQAIKPDVLVKGADYTIDKVVGADLVQSYGGKIVLAKLEEGHSTTSTVKKIAAV
ncbi:MAG: bifunctional D-glycero-beta-D-manno-heptose-7-phosphate kinase/D-glycero-beta-D-manno-heptose 1-phosphate adenylyltransferase HldE [Alphaproteobacteria bacterium]|nr:MAG: bifunctional D-glycero-beta-D-manno-heptose-7-phosphate kinase/D-glycero-beta-D-manno-heptose 1-phosphate adenylyltransferase HldE [Alphaproteobacteria bacterium]